MGSHEYSKAYSPPMPVCTVSIGIAGTDAHRGPFEAILDTGSDITIVPVQILRQIGATAFQQRRARSVWGDSRLVQLYVVSVAIDGFQQSMVQVVGDDLGTEIIIGRFLLNRLTLILDGPAAMTEIIAPSP